MVIISYTKTTFVAGTAPGISASELNKIGDGISATATVADAALPKAGGTMSNTNLVTNLNADLLDGTHLLAIAESNSVGNADLNTVTKSGMYRFETPTNGPPGIGYSQLLVIHGSNDTIIQITGDYISSQLYWRSGNPPNVGGSGAWGVWRKIWHDGNDGAGSGLDADKIQGTQMRFTSGYAEWNDGGTWKAVGGVKSVQRGSIASINGVQSVTLSAVVMAKSFVTLLTSAGTIKAYAKLTTTTNLEITTDAGGTDVSWEVVESN